MFPTLEGRAPQDGEAKYVAAAREMLRGKIKAEILKKATIQECVLVKFGGGMQAGGAQVFVFKETGFPFESIYVPEAERK